MNKENKRAAVIATVAGCTTAVSFQTFLYFTSSGWAFLGAIGTSFIAMALAGSALKTDKKQ